MIGGIFESLLELPQQFQIFKFYPGTVAIQVFVCFFLQHKQKMTTSLRITYAASQLFFPVIIHIPVSTGNNCLEVIYWRYHYILDHAFF